MTIERAAGALDGALEEVEQAIEHLVWSLDQGKSSAQARYGHALADQHQAVADDMLGLAKEARATIGALLETLEGQVDLVGARRALATAQDCLNGLWFRLFTGFYSGEMLRARTAMPREKPTWAAWARGVEDALGRCPPPLQAANEALARCWEDLVDRAGLLSVSVQATGQQIRVVAGRREQGERSTDRETALAAGAGE